MRSARHLATGASDRVRPPATAGRGPALSS